jgi:hypothetical protein
MLNYSHSFAAKLSPVNSIQSHSTPGLVLLGTGVEEAGLPDVGKTGNPCGLVPRNDQVVTCNLELAIEMWKAYKNLPNL